MVSRDSNIPPNVFRAPSVSIIIPAYGVSEWIGEALDSVFRQSYSDFEVIVVDQDLDERMDRALEPFADRIFRLPLHPPGVSAARNIAIRQARGRFIAHLDGDDIWEPDALQVLVDLLDADPSLDAVSPNAILFGEAATEGAIFQHLFSARRPITFEDVVSRRSYIFGAMVYRKAVAVRVGCFDESIQFGEDFDLWIRMLRAGSRIDFTEKTLYRYRRRPSATSAPVIGRLSDVIAVLNKQLEQPGLTPSQREIVETAKRSMLAEQSLAKAKHLLAAHNFAAAREALDFANTFKPSIKLSAISLALRFAPSLVAALARRSSRIPL